MLVISINSSSNIIQSNTKYTNVLGRQLLRAYRCFSCYRNRNYEDKPQSIILAPLELTKYMHQYRTWRCANMTIFIMSP